VRYLEDMAVGEQFELGSFSLTAEDIVAFAQRYDPQPFHLQSDPDGPYGGLIASGWQTGSECHVLLVDGLLNGSACLGSPGITIRFLKPVRAGVRYTARYTVTDIIESRSRPDRGRVTGELVLRDPGGELVYVMEGITIMAKRPPSD
jgi:acyl dehydratase